ncbi:regulatory protein GemA [Sphingomonas sp.]|uniref:regulatory protein GemA n=1 Tax=Sphingomonas sp. TaxID=28214 RepID=UPI002ED7F665
MADTRTERSPARFAVGKPATFDAGSQHRRSMLAKVHIAKKTLGLTDDDYVAVLLRIAGRESAGDCTAAELDAVLTDFKRMGFSPEARQKGPRPADHPAAKKARALWISLGLLGVVRDPSEKALESFARRQLGCTRMAWANQGQVYKLIEALKAMAERTGWSQSTEGLNAAAVPTVLRRRLCEALLAKLHAAGFAPADWNIQRAAYEFAGVEIAFAFVSASTLDTIARAFAAILTGKRS